jgi:uncharacterized repeat protein (TIGR01451 family)
MSRNKGQSLVETALVLPIVLLLVFGVFELGRIVFIFSAVNNASREAARYGASTGATGGGVARYLNCDAIRQTARETAFLAGLVNGDIAINYDRPDTTDGTMEIYGYCDGNVARPDGSTTAVLSTSDVHQGDRIVVTVVRQIDPILPFFPSFAPTFVTARTIVKGIAIGPPECRDGVDNDGDGAIDWPDDDGCESPDDTIEAKCFRLSVVPLGVPPPDGEENVGTTSQDPGPNCSNLYVEGLIVAVTPYKDIRFDPFLDFYDPDDPDQGISRYTFDHWEGVGGSPYPDDYPLYVTMDGDKDITAVFRLMTADLSVTKTASPELVNSGETITYQISVTNSSGSSDTAHNVVVLDTLPEGVTFTSAPGCSYEDPIVRCDVVTLAPGATANFTITVEAPIVDYDEVTLTNEVVVTAFEYDPSENTASADVTVRPTADLRVAKTGPESVEAGAEFSYTITVDNWGPSTATNVTVTDVLPPQVRFVRPGASSNCIASSLTVGATVTCSLGEMLRDQTKIVTFDVIADGGMDNLAQNQATATAKEYDPDLANNNATNAAAYQETTVLSADVAITKSIPGSGQPYRDQPFTYSLVVRNNGPSAAPGVVVTDQLPATVSYEGYQINPPIAGANCSATSNQVSCTLGELAASAQHTIALTVRPSVAGPLTNSATVQSNRDDWLPGNNTSTVNSNIQAVVGLSVTKTGPASINHGADIVYTIAVDNASGYSTANNVQVTDVLPQLLFSNFRLQNATGWSCSGPVNRQLVCTRSAPLAAGQSDSFDIAITPDEPETFTNSVSVNSDEDAVGDDDSHSTNVLPRLDLSVIFAEPPVDVPLPAATPFDYIVTISNSGPSRATDTRLEVVIGIGLSYDGEAESSAWNCPTYDPATRKITCVPTVPIDAGSTTTVRISVTPITVGSVTSSASVTFAEIQYDWQLSNNQDSHTVTIE